MTKHLFGKLSDGREVYSYRISNGKIEAEILDYGATIRSIKVPDSNGNITDVVLFHPDTDTMERKSNFFGATVGRYANRITDGKFILNDIEYTLPKNDNGNCLHGGDKGFDKKIWSAEEIKNGLKMTCTSDDMEEGFPGNLECTVIFTLNGKDLHIEYIATCDKDTVINLTNHSYFNLNGHGNGTFKDHKLMINADFYTPVSETLAATGEILSVENTTFDLRDEKVPPADYDINFVLKDSSYMKYAASATGLFSGITMKTYTTKPGIQIYTSVMLDEGTPGKEGKTYGYGSGICFETQVFPNSTGFAHFPDCILKKGETYNHKTIYSFSSEV